MSEKKYIIIRIILGALIIVLLFVLFFPNKPSDVIKRKIELKLPSSAKILHFNNNRLFGDFDAKIQINEKDIEDINKQLYQYFGDEYDLKNTNYLPNIENIDSWWDVDKANIMVCYDTFIEGKKFLFFSSPKTQEIWAFIVKQNDGKYYLYISYL